MDSSCSLRKKFSDMLSSVNPEGICRRSLSDRAHEARLRTLRLVSFEKESSSCAWTVFFSNERSTRLLGSVLEKLNRLFAPILSFVRFVKWHKFNLSL